MTCLHPYSNRPSGQLASPLRVSITELAGTCGAPLIVAHHDTGCDDCGRNEHVPLTALPTPRHLLRMHSVDSGIMPAIARAPEIGRQQSGPAPSNANATGARSLREIFNRRPSPRLPVAITRSLHRDWLRLILKRKAKRWFRPVIDPRATAARDQEASAESERRPSSRRGRCGRHKPCYLARHVSTPPKEQRKFCGPLEGR